MGWMSLIGDLHGRLPKVGPRQHDIRPDAKLVIIAGDVAPDFRAEHRVRDQLAWLVGPFAVWCRSLRCPVVAVPGNHDRWFWEGARPAGVPWTLLEDGEVRSVAGLTFWGCGRTRDRGCISYISERGMFRLLESMPNDCDVMLTHNPPLGILDSVSHANHVGSLALTMAMYERRPKLAVFGHIHESHGCRQYRKTYCVNATLGAGCSSVSGGLPGPAPYGPWGLSDNSWNREPSFPALAGSRNG